MPWASCFPPHTSALGPNYLEAATVGLGGWPAPGVGFRSGPQLTNGKSRPGLRGTSPQASGDLPPRPAVGGTCSVRVFLGPQTVLHRAPRPQKAPGGPPSLPRLSLRSDGATAPAQACCRRVLTSPLPPPGYALRRLLIPPGAGQVPVSLLWSPLLSAAGFPTAPLPQAPPAPLTCVPSTALPEVERAHVPAIQPQVCTRRLPEGKSALAAELDSSPEQPGPAFHLPLLTFGRPPSLR